MNIVTHTSPDMDAIGAVWLLKRFGGLEKAEVVYVNTGNPDPAVIAGATAVVDTGREYDPARLRFDHHQLPGKAAVGTCATLQVYEHLRTPLDPTLLYLYPIVSLILAGDTGLETNGALWSRAIGIHAMLSALKARGASDQMLMERGCEWLDLLAERANAYDDASRALSTHMVYCSNDGLVVALKDAPQAATFAAIERGARLVVFANYQENAIGVMRSGEWQEPHVGNLVMSVLTWNMPGIPSSAVIDELSTWYRHEAGFFAGRGTRKAPSSDPIAVDVALIAGVLDTAWVR